MSGNNNKKITKRDLQVAMGMANESQRKKLQRIIDEKKLSQARDDRQSEEETERRLNMMDKLGSDKETISYWKKRIDFLSPPKHLVMSEEFSEDVDKAILKEEADSKARTILAKLKSKSIEYWKYNILSLTYLIRLSESEEGLNQIKKEKLPVPKTTFLKRLARSLRFEMMKDNKDKMKAIDEELKRRDKKDKKTVQ